MRSALAAAVALLTAFPAAAQEPLPDYVLAKKLKIAGGGFEGQALLYRDKRLDPKRIDDIQAFYWYAGPLTKGLDPTLAARPPLPAQLHLADRGGRILDRRILKSPFADLAPETAFAKGAAMLLAVETLGGFGTFNGAQASLLAVRDGRLREVEAEAEGDEKPAPIRLIRSQKSDWRVVAKKGGGADLLQAECRPEIADADGYNETYIRYAADGQVWRRTEAMRQGFCDWPNGFPKEDSFPK